MKLSKVTIVILLACLTLLIVSGCAEGNKITAWALTGQDASIKAGPGVVLDEAKTLQVRPTVTYRTADLEGEVTPNSVDVDFLRFFTLEGHIVDTIEYSPFGPFLEGMAIRPYAGAGVNIPWKDRKTEDYQWTVTGGSAFSTDPDWEWAIIVEGVKGEDESGAYLGLFYGF